MIGALKIKLWGEEIGRLLWDERKKRSYFMFNPDYIAHAQDIAPITMPLQSISSNEVYWSEESKIYQKLPAILADALPDAWGNLLFDEWRKTQHLSPADITPLEKLAFIGRRAMGALEFEPETHQFQHSQPIDMASLVQLSQSIYEQRAELHITPEDSLTLQALFEVGTSAGGRMPKAIIAINQETGEIRSGQITEHEGFKYYILKFGEQVRSTAELEMTYYEIATAAGIKMSPSQLIEIEGGVHFLTERFDRVNGEKIHMQTLAAINPEADSYDQLLWTCRRLALPETEMQEVFRRLVFNVLANNTDDHHKNFSFLMTRDGKWHLSPAYDMTYIFDTGGYLPNDDHCLIIGGKTRNITRTDIIDFARRNSIRQPDKIINEVANSIMSFRTIAQKYHVKEQWLSRIELCLNEHLCAWGIITPPQSHTEGIYTNLRIELARKGNIHILCEQGNTPLKHIIRIGTPLHEQLIQTGLANITRQQLVAIAQEVFK